MKTEWLVANVTVVGSLDRTECAILGLIVAWCVFVESFNENEVVGNQCNSYRTPWQSGM